MRVEHHVQHAHDDAGDQRHLGERRRDPVPDCRCDGSLFRVAPYLIQCPMRDQRMSVMKGSGRSESLALYA